MLNVTLTVIWSILGAAASGPWPTGPPQNFGWMGHNAFVPVSNWSVCSLILRKISKISFIMQTSDFKAEMQRPSVINQALRVFFFCDN